MDAVNVAADEEDVAAEARRRDAMIAKLAALEAARKVESEKRREEAAEAADPRESIAAFLREFAGQQATVTDSLAALHKEHAENKIADFKQAEMRLDGIAEAVFDVRACMHGQDIGNNHHKTCGSALDQA